MSEIIDKLSSSLLIRGDERHAYRDPAILEKDGVIHLWCTLAETEPGENAPYMYVVHMKSPDLVHWSSPEKLTVRDRAKNFSSPGNVIECGGWYIMCLQTYCRENGEKFGNSNSRIYTMKSRDLEHWSNPEPILVKGNLPLSECGRMIDPYIFEKDGVWNCFFKQDGRVCRSVSRDLMHWEYMGDCTGGENPCIVKSDRKYYLISSPDNGLDVSVSENLEGWQKIGHLTFGQETWNWAKGRLTAGAAIKVGKLWLMFFHGTGPEGEQVIFDTHACIGVAWSRDLIHWEWK